MSLDTELHQQQNKPKIVEIGTIVLVEIAIFEQMYESKIFH